MEKPKRKSKSETKKEKRLLELSKQLKEIEVPEEEKSLWDWLNTPHCQK